MLSSLKILDFTSLLPGPFATSNLADLGAEVVKIEHPDREDMLNFYGQQVGDHSSLYISLNHAKEIIKVDLYDEPSRQQLLDMVEEFDILIEGFRPGVMKKFGLDYQSLKSLNPKLIYCSLTGYGQETSYSDRAGHDINYLALSGIASYSGHPETGPPDLGIQVADMAGSLYAMNTILAAVIHRNQSGEGSFIDISMRDCVTSLAVIKNDLYLNTGKISHRHDGLLNGGTIYGYYLTSDNKYFSVGSLEDKFVRGLVEALELPTTSLSDPEVKNQLRHKIGQHSLDYWVDFFKDIDVCVEPVLTVDQVFEDEDIHDLMKSELVDGHELNWMGYPARVTQFRS